MSIVIASVLQFALGALWYSPLMFGKLWMQIMEAPHITKEEMHKAQKEMMPFYCLQFLLTITFTFILAIFVNFSKIYASNFSPSYIAILVWLGFIVPTQIGSIIWANTKKKFWIKQIVIMAMYQLIAIIIATFVLMF